MSTQTKKVSVKDFTNHTNKKLYKMQSTAKCLACAWNAGENVILFGPGGYAKSSIAEVFGDYLKQEGITETDVYVLSFNQGITEEKIYGGMDVKKFQDTGEIIYNLQNAFASYEYVVFEEMFDAFPSVLLSLKDTLTSGFVRNGNQMVPIKTKMIVACTNRSRKEIITDLSTAALFERFVAEHEVKWASHDLKDYTDMFDTLDILNDTTHIVAEMVVDVIKKNGYGVLPISPRTAVKAANFVINNDDDFTSLEYFNGFKKTVEEFKAKLKERQLDTENFKEIKDYFFSCVTDVSRIIKASKEKSDNGSIVEMIKQCGFKMDSFPKNRDKVSDFKAACYRTVTSIMNEIATNPFDMSKARFPEKELDALKNSTSTTEYKTLIDKIHAKLQ
jgi:hypothetical protein